MAKSGMRLTKRPPPASKQFAVWRAETARQLQPVADRRAGDYGQVVSGWGSQHKPDFEGQVVVPRSGPISMRVVMKNASKVFNRYGTTIGQLWVMWNKGTRPHPIVPRFATVLRFVVAGAVAFAKFVKRHPGTRGSGAQDKIDKRLRPGEIKGVRRAGRKAWKRVERFNKR